MRYLIVSDLHGNWEALSAILSHVRRKRFDHELVPKLVIKDLNRLF